MANGRTLEEANKQLALLAEQNRTLAADLESLQNQSLVLEKAARDARAIQAAAEKASAGLKSKLETSETQLAEIREANKVLTAQVARLGKQVEKTPLNPLTIEEGSALFDRVIAAFRTSKTLEVKQASLNLKLATAKLGDTAVLLLPDPKSVDPATLHQITIDLIPGAGTEGVSEEIARTTPSAVLAPELERTSVRARTAKAPGRKRR
jgi:hypothetical protein